MEDPNRLWDARLVLFYLLFIYLLKKLSLLVPRSDLNGGFEPEPGLLRPFTLSYQNISFMSFHFRVSNTQKLFQMVGSYTFIYIQYVYKMIYKTLFQRLTILFTKYHMFKRNDMHMTGYILIHHNFLYDSTLLDFAFFLVYSVKLGFASARFVSSSDLYSDSNIVSSLFTEIIFGFQVFW